MPEPGFNDPDFNRPATGRNRRRTGKPVKLPVEYTEFRLSDGRFLGEGFFDVENSQPIPESERLRIRDGNYALAGMFREDPQFRPRPEPADGAFGFDRKMLSGSRSSASGGATSSDVGMPPGGGLDVSDAEEPSVQEERDVALVEQSRATGISPPPFELIPPLPRIQARRDAAGGWWHGASRDGGTRQHNGVDLLAKPGTPVRSPIDGTVYRINYTASGMATITLRNGDGQEVKFFYVAPMDGQGRQLLEPGITVRAGQIIGSVEDLGEGYEDARTGRMKNHVHMRISENGQPVNPFPWLVQWWGNPEGSGKNWYPRRHSVSPGIGNPPDYDAVGEGQRWRRERDRR